jgi:hypothetical protein
MLLASDKSPSAGEAAVADQLIARLDPMRDCLPWRKSGLVMAVNLVIAGVGIR